MHPEDNRAFSEMRRAARQRLAGRKPDEIAAKTGLLYAPATSAFQIPSLGRTYLLSWPDLVCTPAPESWHELVILHYLDMADGFPCTGALQPFSALPGGMIRGGGFDRTCAAEVQSHLGRLDELQLDARCRTLGGTRTETNADFSVVFPFLPHYPVTFKLWFADEELPCSGRMLLDTSAAHYLSVEDAVTVGTLILQALTGSAA